jgi:hypothetical protein
VAPKNRRYETAILITILATGRELPAREPAGAHLRGPGVEETGVGPTSVIAVFFGAQSVVVAGGYLAGNTGVASSLGVGSLLYALTYMVLAIRAVYDGTIARALAHTVVVLAFYWLATIVVAAATIVPVLFWA